MKNLKHKSIYCFLILCLSVVNIAEARRGHKYHKNHKHSKKTEYISLYTKANSDSSKSFNGEIVLPKYVYYLGFLLRSRGELDVVLDDDVTCSYSYRGRRGLLGHKLSFESCSDGSRPDEKLRVKRSIKASLTSRESRGQAKLVVKVLQRYVNGVTFSGLEAQEGQVLKFDGSMWVPSDNLADGAEVGEVLAWDGTSWTPSSIVGQQGPQGVAGADGAAGPMGPQGLKGDKGDKGDTGAAGPQGPQGVAGADGAAGPMGPQGLKGDKGDKGDTGAVGPQGPQGVAGPMGPQGLQGIAGEKGDKGEDATVSLTAGNGIVAGTGANGEIESTGTIAVNVGTSAGQIPQLDSAGKLPASVIPDSQAASGSSVKIAYIKDVKPSGTHGGDCTAGAWNTRDLNSYQGEAFGSVSGNRIALAPGKYLFEVVAPAYLDNIHKARLFNATTGATLLVGTAGRSHTSYGGVNPSFIQGEVVLTAGAEVEVQHRCSASRTIVGFGVAANFGVDEVYTHVKIIKVD